MTIPTALEWSDEAYRAVQCSAPSRRLFFENLRTLLQFNPFDNWQHLMQFMLNGGMKLPVETKDIRLGIAVTNRSINF